MVAQGWGTQMQWYVAKGCDGVGARGHRDMVAQGWGTRGRGGAQLRDVMTEGLGVTGTWWHVVGGHDDMGKSGHRGHDSAGALGHRGVVTWGM